MSPSLPLYKARTRSITTFPCSLCREFTTADLDEEGSGKLPGREDLFVIVLHIELREPATLPGG